MQAILITVTALALGVTALLSVVLVRLLREERRRSDARVRLLSELAGVDAGPGSSATSFTDLDLRPAESPAVQVGALFDEHSEPSPWPRRFAGAGAFALVIALVAFGGKFVTADRTARPAATAAAVLPLELLSLTHHQGQGTLTITGIVQNPRGGGSRANVEATAVVFDAGGKLLASGRAPLDFATLPPGAESPFLIRVNATGAARYRVSFRIGNGQSVPHLDRRTLDAVARKELP